MGCYEDCLLIARVILGLLFFVSGLNGVLHFMHSPPMPPGDAATFATLQMSSSYMTFVALLMLIAGLLLLVVRFVPLALTILGPIQVNLLLFHFLLMHGGAAAGIVATLLELFLIYAYRRSFIGPVRRCAGDRAAGHLFAKPDLFAEHRSAMARMLD